MARQTAAVDDHSTPPLQRSIQTVAGAKKVSHKMGETILLTSEIPTPPQLESPVLNLLSVAYKKEYLEFGVPFYYAAMTGDTDTARRILKMYPDIVRARITRGWETGLHIAAAAKSVSFVKMLVTLMTPDEIAMKNDSFDTALCFAIASGIVDITKEVYN
ncbi:hypothetical protein QQ045_030827 [Rhodiola kirilowii]